MDFLIIANFWATCHFQIRIFPEPIPWICSVLIGSIGYRSFTSKFWYIPCYSNPISGLVNKYPNGNPHLWVFLTYAQRGFGTAGIAWRPALCTSNAYKRYRSSISEYHQDDIATAEVTSSFTRAARPQCAKMCSLFRSLYKKRSAWTDLGMWYPIGTVSANKNKWQKKILLHTLYAPAARENVFC